ncbi:hypothetical protein GQ44DRAFT_625153, partial [Phaeosphaeriaceae sp. PMI808]
GTIAPRSFRLYQGLATAYEFAYSKEALTLSDPFQTEALTVLEVLHLDQIFGLRRLDDHDPGMSVEVTEGEVNIMLETEAVHKAELIEALWVFGEDDNDRCHCREDFWPTKDGHNQDHDCGQVIEGKGRL